MQEIASNRNEDDREMFKEALLCILENPRRILFIDKSAKDRQASRRMRAWCLRGRKAELKRWFSDSERYTLIGICDIFGFHT